MFRIFALLTFIVAAVAVAQTASAQEARRLRPRVDDPNRLLLACNSSTDPNCDPFGEVDRLVASMSRQFEAATSALVASAPLK